MVLDPTLSDLDMNAFEVMDWTPSESCHLQGKEEVFPKLSQPGAVWFCDVGSGGR